MGGGRGVPFQIKLETRTNNRQGGIPDGGNEYQIKGISDWEEEYHMGRGISDWEEAYQIGRRNIRLGGGISDWEGEYQIGRRNIRLGGGIS